MFGFLLTLWRKTSERKVDGTENSFTGKSKKISTRLSLLFCKPAAQIWNSYIFETVHFSDSEQVYLFWYWSVVGFVNCSISVRFLRIKKLWPFKWKEKRFQSSVLCVKHKTDDVFLIGHSWHLHYAKCDKVICWISRSMNKTIEIKNRFL